ncbi:sodium:solute symporter [Nocardioides sp. KC13]|uniref:Sodium:solute symporter n=1 Tax=Nocardioides turkmenicus TaxID=2711220 RepID=A0A6M1RB12_9ACTN|nr:sodium:solute symporter [Nocardioides sp. KC13]NGN94818.1 sodium:solute symporter [Nocardioides sp. KC13]
MDLTIIVIYLAAMVAFGWWGKTRTSDSSDFLVAGRRLGPVLYTGTMSALVLGGASTVGGVALGYEYGISGAWLVAAIALGVLALSLFFAGRIQRLRIFTVAQMLELRYGVGATAASGLVMVAYTLMLAVTSTMAYATVFNVLFGTDRVVSVLIGGVIVVIYSTIGGMWSITLTDMVQFILQTVGIFLLLLPFTWSHAGGLDGIKARAADSVFDLGAIGTGTVITYIVVYTFGMLIGQDIWQRVFTARSPQVARWGGTASGVYCLVYGVAGALIGAAASTFVTVEDRNDVYATIAESILPAGISGLVLAAAVAAMMSTASGALIATATVARTDVQPLLARLVGRTPAPVQDEAENPEHDVRSNRIYVVAIGIAVVVIASLLSDVVSALTIAYDILVGGLLVPILGGFVWRRATGVGAVVAMAAGTVATLGTMAVVGDVLANEPVYAGLVVSAVAYVLVSLLTRPTDPAVMREWTSRLAEDAPESAVLEGSGR